MWWWRVGGVDRVRRFGLEVLRLWEGRDLLRLHLLLLRLGLLPSRLLVRLSSMWMLVLLGRLGVDRRLL